MHGDDEDEADVTLLLFEHLYCNLDFVLVVLGGVALLVEVLG